MVRDDAVGERLRAIGVEPNPGGPEAVAALLAAERAVWVPLIRALGITLDGRGADGRLGAPPPRAGHRLLAGNVLRATRVERRSGRRRGRSAGTGGIRPRRLEAHDDRDRDGQRTGRRMRRDGTHERPALHLARPRNRLARTPHRLGRMVLQPQGPPMRWWKVCSRASILSWWGESSRSSAIAKLLLNATRAAPTSSKRGSRSSCWTR